MKKTFFTAILFSLIAITQISYAQNSKFFSEANTFFNKYVKEGLVDYKSVKSDPALLENLVKQIGSYPVGSVSANEQKAFYINAYNVLVIKSIVDRYPTKSPMNISGFFDGKKHLVGGKKMTLNELEKGKLIKTTQDARLHFVLVCAAISCPKIANFAFTPDKVESQIETRTKLALNDNQFIRAKEKSVQVSEIFKWYASDFKKDAGSIVKYLNKYRTEKVKDGAKVGYYTYNWSLNTL